MEYIIGAVILAVISYILLRRKEISKEEKIENTKVKSVPTEQKVYWIKDGKKEWGRIKYMPQGLQVFDENGNCTLDATSRLCKVIGILDTGIDDGYIENEAFKSNNYWVFDLEMGLHYPEEPNGYWYRPRFYQNVERGALGWTFDKDGNFKNGSKLSRKVIYGVY